MDVEGEALPPQPTDRRAKQISKRLPTRSSSFSSVGSKNHDQLHASLTFSSPPYYQNPSIPSSSSSPASHHHRPILDPSSTFSSLSSSFNHSPPRNNRPKRRRVSNSCHRGEVGGRPGYTDSTSPPPNQNQPQNNTELVLPQLFREQELAKLIFLLVVPIIAAVINLYNRLGHPPPPVLPHLILGLLLFAILVIWTGLLLKETDPRKSVAAGSLGSCAVILALVLLVACVVPGVTLPWLLAGIFCFGLCMVSPPYL